ncbi:peptidoglycan-binding protein [Marinomonas ostreistagni]|uniref:peptidoglycan-binding protein n=1 Tax=Marinomonas ostreistagni TaxID=359209 RepID=UPI001951434F|nr:peptidoglycan-binding protein [Marinomonas ostreistagni]
MSTNKNRLLLGSVLTALALHLPHAMAETISYDSNMNPQASSPPPPAMDMEVKPGQCWVYGQIKPRKVEKTVSVTVKDSHTTINVTPAEIKRGYKKVVTREGTVTYRLQPATYKRVTERVLVREETTRYVKVPAVYEERDKRVVVEEAQTVLEQCSTPGAGVAFCAREIPAKEEVVKVQVLVQPEQSKVEVVPAKFEEVTKWVVDQPARVVEVSLAPRMEEVEVEEIVTPASANPYQVPAQTRKIQTQVYEGSPRMVMRQAVCNNDLNSGLVAQLQQRLKESGYEAGPADGRLGQKTMEALGAFQGDNGLAVGSITFEALNALGINPNN